MVRSFSGAVFARVRRSGLRYDLRSGSGRADLRSGSGVRSSGAIPARSGALRRLFRALCMLYNAGDYV